MKRYLLVTLPILIFVGCNINSSTMLKTPTDYVFDELPSERQLEYTISPNDIIEFRMFKMDAVSLIDITSSMSGTGGGNNATQVKFLVERDGFCKLPILGKTMVAGRTIKEAEAILEKLYEKYYKNAYVQIRVTNRRVVVFPGTGGSARVLSLDNENTTLFEALALAGGITDQGKASKVKLIRSEGNARQVYLLDLSKIEGLDDGDVVLQANDIIYVEPTKEVAREVLRDVAPVLSLLTSALFLVTIAQTLAK